MGPNVPNSRSEFSTCTDVDIVTSSRLKTSVKLAELIPWDDLEDDDAAQFCHGFGARFGAPAKPFRMALGALIIKARMGLTDEELVEQIKENPYLQFFTH